MRQTSIEELDQLLSEQYNDIWDAARSVGRDVKVYLHWTAGKYDQLFDDYHINIDGYGNIYLSTDDLSEVLPATYHRNTGSIAVTLCCSYGATCYGDHVDFGDYPPTEAQINAMSLVVAHIAKRLDLTIDKQRIMTHGEAANNEDGLYLHEPYAVWSDPQPSDGDTRWDLAVLHEDDEWRSGGDTLRGNALWYQANYDI